MLFSKRIKGCVQVIQLSNIKYISLKSMWEVRVKKHMMKERISSCFDYIVYNYKKLWQLVSNCYIDLIWIWQRDTCIYTFWYIDWKSALLYIQVKAMHCWEYNIYISNRHLNPQFGIYRIFCFYWESDIHSNKYKMG